MVLNRVGGIVSLRRVPREITSVHRRPWRARTAFLSPPRGSDREGAMSEDRTDLDPCVRQLENELDSFGGGHDGILWHPPGAAVETALRDPLGTAQYRHGFPAQRSDSRRRHRRPVRGQRAARARAARHRLRAGRGDRRDRRRRLCHAERRTSPRKHRARRRGRALGRPCRPGIRVFPPRRRPDRAGTGHRRRRVECLLRHAPRRLRRISRRAPSRRHHPHRPPRGRLPSRLPTSPA